VPPTARTPHPIFARCYAALAPLSEGFSGPGLRREMLAGLRGRVVEVGAGSGLNFPHYPSDVTEVVAVEPETHLRRTAERAALKVGTPPRLLVLSGVAEQLPLPESAFEAGVAALVLCSVDDQREALRELHRVIKAGGELRFLEHVRGHPLMGTAQDWVDPCWTRLAGGCHLNRDTEAAIAASGFEVVSLRSIKTRVLGVPIPGPTLILGRAVKV